MLSYNRKSTVEEIDTLIDELPEDYRVVLLLSEEEGFKDRGRKIRLCEFEKQKLICLSVVNKKIDFRSLVLRVLLFVCISRHRQRRDPMATFDHSDMRGLFTA